MGKILSSFLPRILNGLLTVRKVMAGDMIHGHVIHGIFLPLDFFGIVALVSILITLDSRFISQIRDRVRTIVGVGVGVVGVVGVGPGFVVSHGARVRIPSTYS